MSKSEILFSINNQRSSVNLTGNNQINGKINKSPWISERCLWNIFLIISLWKIT